MTSPTPPPDVPLLLGVDTGGTFTDFVLLSHGRIRVHKVLSTPAAPERAILQGIADLGLTESVRNGQVRITHGSTVATNAALEGKGVKTVFITNRGFRDLLTIGRQTRPQLYRLHPPQVMPPVPRDLCLEVDTRRDARGKLLTPLTDESLQQLAQEVAQLAPESVAINLLFSYLNGEEEQRIADAMPPGLFVSRASEVLPEYREYERGIATWLNAWLGPIVHHYLNSLAQAVTPSPLTIMQSTGGTIDAEQAAGRAVSLLLSGPAGGLAAARFIDSLTGNRGLMTFDMGGTSTDVALVDGELKITNEGKLGAWPVAVPMVDMHTIGAGGGSLASIDTGGVLQVGPESAGADPGPACYGKGGTRATVTDANAVLGRLRPDNFLGGAMALDTDAARQAVGELAAQANAGQGEMGLEEMALGIIQLANEHMARALRVISVQRGYDPAGFRLCCFGGAGGLHVCALAERLGMHRALVPRYGGVLSALGMLVAPRERQLSRTHQCPLDSLDDRQLQDWLQALHRQGIEQLQREGIAEQAIQQQASLDLRYLGQSYTINVPYRQIGDSIRQFHRQHERLYGHRLARQVELVTLRLRVYSNPAPVTLPTLDTLPDPVPLDTVELFALGRTPVFNRDDLGQGATLDGPALICETVSTTLVAPGWQARVDDFGNLLMEKS